MRIGQETYIEDQIALDRQSVLETEGRDRDRQGRCKAFGEELLLDRPSKLLRPHVTRVDYHVGATSHSRKRLALRMDSLDDSRSLVAHRMLAAGLLETTHEHLIARFKEEQVGWDLVLDVDTNFLEFGRICAKLLIKALKFHEVRHYFVKFSGRTGWHIIVPYETFPEEVNGIPTRKLFPEAAIKISQYLMDMIKNKLSDELLDSFGFEELMRRSGKKYEELVEEGEFNLILANIYGDILLDVAEELVNKAASGGQLLLSGILWEYNFDIRQKYQKLGCRLIKNRLLDQYSTVLLQKE